MKPLQRAGNDHRSVQRSLSVTQRYSNRRRDWRVALVHSPTNSLVLTWPPYLCGLAKTCADPLNFFRGFVRTWKALMTLLVDELRLTPDNVVRIGALRSKLVSKLTGLTRTQLQYWHGTELLPAHQRRGARGYPRLYSWVDYMKLREAAKLSSAGVPTRAIRKAVPFLERMDAEWYFLPLEVYAPKRRQITAHLRDGLAQLADEAGQFVLPWATFEATIVQLELEGPLGELHDFADAVTMDPSVFAGNPILLGTRLETDFIAGLASMGYGSPDIAVLYRLSEARVIRALAFEEKVAA
jgi:DNA-binding transcriptional MerR regulator/uncharacterized protein (DUF433 family)